MRHGGVVRSMLNRMSIDRQTAEQLRGPAACSHYSQDKPMAQFRYIVDDVDAAVAFYRDHLGFALVQQFGPAMAILTRDDLQLWVAGPMASASKPMPDGARPAPGGWSRCVLVVSGLEERVADLRAKGVTFRNDIVAGPGGKQILCADPSGNIVELFEPA